MEESRLHRGLPSRVWLCGPRLEATVAERLPFFAEIHIDTLPDGGPYLPR